MFRFLSLFICTLILASSSFAYERTITAEWTAYTPPQGVTATGFKLYKEGVLACTFTGAALVKGECTVDLVKASTPFTLTALFSDGKESPHSPPYTLVDYGPGPQGLKLTVVTIRTVSTLTKHGNVIAKTTMTREEVPEGTTVKQGVRPGYRNAKGEYINTTVIVM